MPVTGSTHFYADLPIIEDFFDASEQQNYHRLPDDWYVAATDIVNSTAAIEDDHYKTVNILGASPIVGILNVADRSQIPYTFGGDGAAFCFPPTILDDAKRVLGATRKIGKEQYDLDLRAAIFPVSLLREHRYDIRLARYKASDHYVQAIFTGGGISYAEELLKQEGHDQYRIPATDDAESVDFTGLECRWKEVEQPDKEVITLLVRTNPSLDNPEKTYGAVLQEMRDIFGFDNKTNPINTSDLKMNLSFSKLMGEAKFRTFGKGLLKRLGYILRVQLQTIIGKVLMALDYETSATDWSLYRSDMARNSDHRKFDDMLRVVISGSTDQRKELEEFLQQQFQNERLAYGIHISDAAMITCMVFQYHRDHVHFVDGKNGGYVSAAKGLKERLAKLTDS
jgi:hypothetical protein